jgi:hypothetical protein
MRFGRHDIFEPHMPEVDVLSDMGGLFAKTRAMLEAENITEYIQRVGFDQLIRPDKPSKGQRHVAIITPRRMVYLQPAPGPNTQPEQEVTLLKELLPGAAPLQITVISYTELEAYMEDKTRTRCIPFLGYLLGFAYIGHNVVVFEGHPSALEHGARNSDVLIIDSGMLPFMPENWAEIVFPVMKSDPRIFIHQRKTYELMSVARKKSPPGWRYSEPDGEASYANILLTTLAKARDKDKTVSIISGQALPNPKELTTDAGELEFISTLPFRYEQLNAETVIKILWDNGQPGNFLKRFQPTRTFKARLVDSNGRARDVAFQLKLSSTSNENPQLEIKLL